MEQRTFGKTGEKFSILSFGGQRIVDGHGVQKRRRSKLLITLLTTASATSILHGCIPEDNPRSVSASGPPPS